MNRYEPSNFRPLFGIAAVAMTALTIAASVLVPASLSPPGREDFLHAKRAAHVTEVAIDPARVDVIGMPETRMASLSARDAAAGGSQHG